MDKIAALLAAEFSQKPEYVKNVISLIDEGNTIPFIARYRKEMHGSMDDQLLREISERLQYLRSLDKRREEIKSLIESQGKLTDKLVLDIDEAVSLAELDDIYRPYRQKRRTRASVAREKGLEPLAQLLFAQNIKSGSLEELAKPYVNPEKGVETETAALAGAADIIAEDISDNAEIRKRLKELIGTNGLLISKAAKDEDSVYSLYYDFTEPLKKLQSHRILAINRGEKEGFLKVSVKTDEDTAIALVKSMTVRNGGISGEFVAAAAEDAYARLIFPSIERELRNELTEKASEQAIKTFALNLKPLLLQPPVKNRVALGFDPAYRT
ncbi:MAG: RNA-binding transcriptional accessory protein, partial [Clostridiales bacterium]|nr:RNA-binding transcriptional accessory protein [Clostridiales bacterium]